MTGDINVGPMVETTAAVPAERREHRCEVRLSIFPKMIREGREAALIFRLPDYEYLEPQHSPPVDWSVSVDAVEDVLEAIHACVRDARAAGLLPPKQEDAI